MELRRLFHLRSIRIAPVHRISDSISTEKLILELNLIAAQISRLRKRTYVVAYINSGHKLVSKVDLTADFTWNDKLFMSVDRCLLSDRPNACMTFEIYQERSGKFKADKKIGVAQVLVQNLIPEESGGIKFMPINIRTDSHKTTMTKRFACLKDEADDQSQGVLNIGVVRLDGTPYGSSFLGSWSDSRTLMRCGLAC